MPGLVHIFHVWGAQARFWPNCKMVSRRTWEKRERGIAFSVFLAILGAERGYTGVFDSSEAIGAIVEAI